MYLHLHGQSRWHDDITIIGNREALTRLRSLIDATLAQDAVNGISSARSSDIKDDPSFFTNDGEGYFANIVLLEDSDERWKALKLPYTDFEMIRPQDSDLIWNASKRDFERLDSYNGKTNAVLAVLEAAKTIVSQIENGITPTLCPSSVAGDIDPDFEDALDQIRNWPISRSYILLFEFINQVWRHSFGQLSAISADDGAVEYTFTTGGWSENEEILEALKQQRLAWALTWQRSERGGKHVFKEDRG